MELSYSSNFEFVKKYGSYESYLNNLKKAIDLAFMYHSVTTDMAGDPYVHHVLRVMSSVAPQFKIVALLHDIVEDTNVTIKDLESFGFHPADIHSIDLLTHKHGVSYEDYIDTLRGDLGALTVKLADLTDNMDLKRAVPEDKKDYMDNRRRTVYVPAFAKVSELLSELVDSK